MTQAHNNPKFASEDDYPVDKNNLSPRVGFSYVLDGRARSVLRGGFGLFFQRTPTCTTIGDWRVSD